MLNKEDLWAVVDDVLKKSGPMQEILKKPPLDYNGYYVCLKMLRMGIWATKFNYNNKRHRVVYIYLGKDGQSLVYKT